MLSAHRICFFAMLAVGTCWMGSDSVSMAEDNGAVVSADSLVLESSSRRVLQYNAGLIPSPDPKQPWFARSGFIHPVYTPAGHVVTEAFPYDHMHQHGLMFAWTRTQFDGHAIDFWNSAKRQGSVEHVGTTLVESDHIVVRLRHVDNTGQTPVTVLNETWDVRTVPHASLNVFDLVSTQQCATAKPLTIQEYHYGGMCIRGSVQWLDPLAVMRTSLGHDRKQGNHTRPNWVSMSGAIDGHDCGIVAMSHPDNYRAPQPVRLHPNKPYFCFAPMVLGEFQIRPDQPYVSRYRFVAFDGSMTDEAINELWNTFSQSDGTGSD